MQSPNLWERPFMGKAMTQSNMGRKVFISSYSLLGHHEEKSGQEPRGRNYSRGHGGGTVFVAVRPLISFTVTTSGPAMACSKSGLALLPQSLIKGTSHRLVC